jgi:hypothetical protein
MLPLGRWTLIFGLLPAWLAVAPLAWAHAGAPYPVLLEEPVGPYVVSALADPDVGGGEFFVLVEVLGGEVLPEATMVVLWVEPEDRHAGEQAYPAQRQETRYGERFVAEVPFDREGLWKASLVIEGPPGSGEISFPVEVTPPGVGWIATVACLVPFVILGLLWLRGTRRQRSRQ